MHWNVCLIVLSNGRCFKRQSVISHSVLVQTNVSQFDCETIIQLTISIFNFDQTNVLTVNHYCIALTNFKETTQLRELLSSLTLHYNTTSAQKGDNRNLFVVQQKLPNEIWQPYIVNHIKWIHSFSHITVDKRHIGIQFLVKVTSYRGVMLRSEGITGWLNYMYCTVTISWKRRPCIRWRRYSAMCFVILDGWLRSEVMISST